MNHILVDEHPYVLLLTYENAVNSKKFLVGTLLT